MKDIKNKTIVVTGANGGMGKSTVDLLSHMGAKVIALDLNFDEPYNKDVLYIKCDLCFENQIDIVKSKIEELNLKVYAIVNMAGIYDLDSLIEISEERFINMFNINLFGVYRVNKALFPLMEEEGRIVIISSELANIKLLPFTGLYAITKGALEKYAESLRMELNLHNKKVIVIRPGAVKTNLISHSKKALESFVSDTENYNCNAERFKNIVDNISSKNVSPKVIANKVSKALTVNNPRLIYNVNRNFLLLLYNIIPKGLALKIIKIILK